MQNNEAMSSTETSQVTQVLRTPAGAARKHDDGLTVRHSHFGDGEW